MMKRLINQSGQPVVYPVGHIDASNALKFQSHLEEVLQELGSSDVLVVDMSQVDFLDSAGLMALLHIRTTAQIRGVQIILCAIPASVQIMLELTQLDRVFPVMPSDEARGTATLSVPQSAIKLAA
jgi:anti-anti-sigma factor